MFTTVDVSRARWQDGNTVEFIIFALTFLLPLHFTLQVLKGLALLRLGRPDDCVALIDEVHKQSPTDEQTLQAMTIYYKELDQRKKFSQPKVALYNPIFHIISAFRFHACFVC